MGLCLCLAEKVEDAQEVVDVLELLDRLPGEEARRVEIGRVVQPVAALDAGHLAVKELVDDPAQDLPVARGDQARASEVERHLLARKKHGYSDIAPFPVGWRRRPVPARLLRHA